MKKCSQAPYGFAKPQARLLHAEVPCNYILGRLAAALQNVFETRNSPSAFFHQLEQLGKYRLDAAEVCLFSICFNIY